MEFSYQEEVLTELEEDVLSGETRELVVFNDDVNTFDHVINTLIKVCKHSADQAEQCTYIIHFKGKCAVKVGAYEFLRPMREGITDAGIGASIL